MNERRNQYGRFANAVDDRPPITVVREILLAVAEHATPPILPLAVSQDRFDRA